MGIKLERGNCVVIDLETARSVEDCRHCGQARAVHYADGACAPWEGERPASHITQFASLGWNNKPALGLSIGAYWDYQTQRLHWFDPHTLQETIEHFVARCPLLVSFNGFAFDFVLMRGLLRQRADAILATSTDRRALEATNLIALCDLWKPQCASSYDILQLLWQADPESKYVRGLNNLDSIAQANGLGAKLGSGAEAPRWWAEGQHARVLNYCQSDVYLTKALFELVIASDGWLRRGDGSRVQLPLPTMEPTHG